MSVDFANAVAAYNRVVNKSGAEGLASRDQAKVGDFAELLTQAAEGAIDPDAYVEYTKRTPAVIERYGGRFLARGGRTVSLEGAEESRRIVLVEFDSVEQAEAFYRSPEYQEAKTYREEAAVAEFIVVDGV